MSGTRCGMVAVLAAAGVAAAAPRDARAQFSPFLGGDAVPRRILNALSLVTEGEKVADMDYGRLGRWMWGAAENTVASAAEGLPNAEFRMSLADAKRRLERDDRRRAVRRLDRAGAALGRLAEVWEVGDAPARLDELRGMAERSDRGDAIAALEALAARVRIDPLQRHLDAARADLEEGIARLRKGSGPEAAEAAQEAKRALRRAYFASRVTQAKMILARARILAAGGSRFRAGYLLRRADRKLGRARFMSGEAEGAALAAVGDELRDAREMLRRGEAAAPGKMADAEAMLTALLDGVRPAPALP
ncbi:MAG: hypothetical protein PHN82_02960 [bacterium]|nr:hypothetical protein [bacterium]